MPHQEVLLMRSDEDTHKTAWQLSLRQHGVADECRISEVLLVRSDEDTHKKAWHRH